MGEASTSARSESVRRARDALASGRGVLVVGEPGAGRTYFMRSVIADLDDAAKSRLWIGDDVQRLDGERAAKLLHAVTSGTIVPFATAATGRPLGAAIERVVRDGGMVRVDLPALRPQEMLAATQRFLGGPLDTDAVPAFVPQRAGGDLVILQEFVRTAQISGCLVDDEGVWRLTSATLPTDGLRRLLRSRLGELTSLSPLKETILDVVALAPELSLSTFKRVMDALEGEDVTMELERLEDECIIDILVNTDQLSIRIHDAAIELTLPNTIGTLRRGRLVAAIVDVLEMVPTAALASGELAALARYAPLLGRSVDASALTKASNAALLQTRTELAYHFAVTAVEAGGGTRAQLALAAAEGQLGLLARAQDRLATIQARSLPEDPIQSAVTHVSRLLAERRSDPLARWEMQAEWRTPIEDTRLTSNLRLDSARDILSPASIVATALQPIDPAALLEGDRLTTSAMTACFQGRMHEALHLLDEAEAVLAPVGGDLTRVLWTRAYLQCYVGALDPQILILEDLRDRAAAQGQGVTQAYVSYAIGAILVSVGRCQDSLSDLRSARDLFERYGLSALATDVRVEIALATAMTGETLLAKRELDAVLERSQGISFLDGRSLLAQGWIQAVRGERSAAISSFISASERFREQGLSLHSLLALIHAARAGAARSVLERVEVLSRDIDHSLPLTTRLARALATFEYLEELSTITEESAREAARVFDELAGDAAEFGWAAVSAEASYKAAWLYAAVGDERGASASARRGEEQLTVCGIPTLPFLTERATTSLSPREWEVAELAAAHRSNREIAEALVLSVRTVETHLQRVYRKLGIRRRDELTAAIGVQGTVATE